VSQYLARLREQRAQQVAFIDELVERVEADNRDLVQAERTMIDGARERISELDEQIKPLESFETLATESRSLAAAGSPARRSSGERRLDSSNDGPSWETPGAFLRDLVMGDPRIVRHGLDPDRRAAERIGAFREQQSRALAQQTTADTPGLLPKPLIGPVINLLDASRPLVNSLGVRDLSNVSGKTFSRPRITQHVDVDKQTAEKTELATRKMIIGSLDFDKETYGGAVNVSRQDLDWTDPGAWQILLDDLADVYSIETETAVAAAFAAGVTNTVEVAGTTPVTDILPWLQAMYSAASAGYGAGKRLPDTVWLSLDMWAKIGPIFDAARIAAGSLGDSNVESFAGQLGGLPRVAVPTLPAGTAIVGPRAHYEFYEQRIGVLSAVEPGILGVEVAYGGYVAHGFVNATSFRKVADAT
jgi:HK97 family phage major capsid protein